MRSLNLKLCELYRFSDRGRKRSPHSNTYSVLKEAESKGFNLSNNLSWFGVLKHHHGWNVKLYPDTPDLFLLDMADSLAASISRGDNQLRLGCRRPFIRYGFDDRTFKLWKNHPKDRKRGRRARPLKLEKVFEFLAGNSTLDKFYEFVGESIYERAEDATIGANLTSLHIHSILTGKFYRLLKKASYIVPQAEINKRNVQKVYTDRINEWNFTISKLKIHFPQRPVRSKDMNVFEKLKETRQKIEADFKDHIFFNTSDEIIIVQTPDMDIHILKPYLDYGFWIEYSERKQFLKDLNPNPDDSIGEFKEGLALKKLPSEKIVPSICEICQKDKASKEWIKDYILSMEICESCKRVISEHPWPPDKENLCKKDIVSLEEWFDEKTGEDLCQDCFNIRTCLPETRLHKLKEWSEKEENPKVIWVKVNLDFFELIKSLERLYARYLKDIGVPDFGDKVEIRFSVLSEFHKDYEKFLKDFEKSLREDFKENMEVPILEDFFVIKIGALSQIMDPLKTFYNLFINYFPQFKDINSSPLKISISCSNAKFPFFEHWEILQEPKSDVHITLIDEGKVKANIKSLEEILIRSQYVSKASIGALHKLANIAKLSEKLAQVALKDKSDKDYKTYKDILPMGMDFNSLLTFAKIMEDQYEVS